LVSADVHIFTFSQGDRDAIKSLPTLKPTVVSVSDNGEFTIFETRSNSFDIELLLDNSQDAL
jgi:hypothetical protein